ncbi:MAG: hypothetical protein LAT68_15730 [Cyclobacteriaceae bacterium]|nr:hypothetical protein [Cyclobacteriaceae bacterium]MCH8517769.1 hypothetical protein [Cyclobacteriaceae bacterium]
MQVFVNDHLIRIHEGAIVLDAIRSFDPSLSKMIGKLSIKDAYGNEISPDGSLLENEHIYIEKSNQSSEL